MKIALIGTHGTGKTTTVHEIIAALKKNSVDAGYLEETARRCPLPINEDRTKQSQRWIFYEHLVKEIELEPKSDVLVCDRSLLDIYAYYFAKFGENKSMEKVIEENMPTYSLLFYFPLDKFNKRLQKDKARSTEETFQKEIDVAILKLFEKFNVKYSIYNDLESAFSEILSILKIKKS
jgi:thymidylate kinase